MQWHVLTSRLLVRPCRWSWGWWMSANPMCCCPSLCFFLLMCVVLLLFLYWMFPLILIFLVSQVTYAGVLEERMVWARSLVEAAAVDANDDCVRMLWSGEWSWLGCCNVVGWTRDRFPCCGCFSVSSVERGPWRMTFGWWARMEIEMLLLPKLYVHSSNWPLKSVNKIQ